MTFQDEDLEGTTWESCLFEKCNLSGLKLKQSTLSDCTFTDCDLSNLSVPNSRFNRVSFLRCKMLGIKWTDADQLLFSISARECNLSFSNFFGMKLKKTPFTDSKAQGVIFTDADLTEADMRKSDFEEAIFLNTNLSKADFTGAINYDIDILSNKVKQAKFNFPEAARLLRSLGIKIEV